MSYKKILLPVGHEENSRAAFETAARLARESHGTLYLVHVVPLRLLSSARASCWTIAGAPISRWKGSPRSFPPRKAA